MSQRQVFQQKNDAIIHIPQHRTVRREFQKEKLLSTDLLWWPQRGHNS